jgi:hypothetical protein
VNLYVVNITALKPMNKGEPGCGKYCSIEVNVAAVNIVSHRISANQSVVMKFELLQAVNIV